MIRTRFTEQFGISVPIMNAPMALIAGGALAAAVTRSGGLGVIGGGYAGTLGGEPPLAEEFAKAAGARVGIGFITWALAQAPELLERALALMPAFIFLSFTDPGRFSRRILEAGVPLICQVQTLAQVGEALVAGASVIVAQGTEAGGHGGARSTLPLVPEVADYLMKHAPQTLLLAAGGIADGRGLAAALMLGADGVVLGTRLWAAREALTADGAVARAVAATGDATIRTTAVDALRDVAWPREFSFRVMKNQLTDTWSGREAEAETKRGSLRETYAAARAAGDFDIVPAVAGEAIGLVHGREPAAELMSQITLQAEAWLVRGGSCDFRR